MDRDQTSQSPKQALAGGKARTWVPRACDRCRKRRARCDEAVPCKNCADAGATCTHDAPVLKRGPRPKRAQQSQDLEARVRSLEHLISSIPGGATGSSSHLSLGELDQIRTAAQPTPGSEPSPREFAVNGFPSFVPSAGYLHSDVGAGPSNWAQRLESQDYVVFKDLIGLHEGPGSGGMDSFANVPLLGSVSLNGIDMDRAIGSALKSPRSSGQDLLYRDEQGQTKFLGASSGMPLLDKLKPGIAPQTGLSLAEEWISLSAAIGMDIDQQQLPQSGPSPHGLQSLEKYSAAEDDDLCWSNLIAVVPADLVDILVRSYFTISHLLWPILHAPSFMTQYSSPQCRRNPSFVALVMSICCLSCRYAQDPRLNHSSVSVDLINLSKETVTKLASERSDLELVQAMFNMSVVQEGTARPNQLWVHLSQALSMAIDLGLHRSVDEYSSFSAIDSEVRKRTMWALYSQDVKASCTYGRPPMLRLTDLDLDEPSAVDDVYITEEQGVGSQPFDRPSVMAGFVAAVRLHMILERTIRRVNKKEESDQSQSIRSLLLPLPRTYRVADELDLLARVTEGLHGDWTYTPGTVADPDSVRFFQKTRVFTLQHFIRLLVARHRFSELLERSGKEADNVDHPIGLNEDGTEILQQITQSALGIIGTYCVIEMRGRLGFFGAHAIAQLTQAGAGLIGVLLHLRSTGQSHERIWHLAMQGLPAAIQTLRQLGRRRSAGLRSAELLAEFSRACRIPVFTGPDPAASANDADTSSQPPVEIPMLRTLPRRTSTNRAPEDDFSFGTDMEEWLGLALSGSPSTWVASGNTLGGAT